MKYPLLQSPVNRSNVIYDGDLHNHRSTAFNLRRKAKFMKPGLISTPTTQWNVMPHIFEGEWIYRQSPVKSPDIKTL